MRGKALQAAAEWALEKNLSYQDKQYLAASKEKEIKETIAAKEQEAALERARKDREATETRNQIFGLIISSEHDFSVPVAIANGKFSLKISDKIRLG